MQLSTKVEGPDVPNHPKSIMMAVIAFVVFNIGIGTVMGTPGVLLPKMAGYLGVSPAMAAGGMALVILASAVFSPQIGSLAVKHSLRGIVGAAAIMLTLAWVLLAFTHSYWVYLAVYGLLLGPSMSITGSVLAPTLVTRWFTRHRGLAIGLVHIPIMVAIMPIATQLLIQHFGLQTTFLLIAAITIVTLGPCAFLIIDWPPHQNAAGESVTTAPPPAAYTIPKLLADPRFWALSVAVAMPNTSSTLLGLHLVSMAEHWGITPVAAAGLASIMSLGGMIGTVAFGSIADKIGGARTLALMAVLDCALWLLFLAGFAYMGLVALIFTIGLVGSGAVPAMSKALADRFGAASFSRAIGLMVPVTLPILILGQIVPGLMVKGGHGDYSPVVVMMSVGFAVASVLALWAAGGLRGSPPAAAEPATA